jgi:hypothetical protein
MSQQVVIRARYWNTALTPDVEAGPLCSFVVFYYVP